MPQQRGRRLLRFQLMFLNISLFTTAAHWDDGAGSDYEGSGNPDDDEDGEFDDNDDTCKLFIKCDQLKINASHMFSTRLCYILF